MFIVVHPVDPVRYGHAVDRPFGGMPSRLLSRDRSGLFDDADRWHTGWHGRQRLKIFFFRCIPKGILKWDPTKITSLFLVESVGSRADPVRILSFTVHFRVCYPCHCAQCLGATQFDIFEWEMLGPEATETCFFS